MKIWIDADACPNGIKEIVYKAVERLKIPAVLVSNQYLRIPASQYLSQICVEKSFDAADFYIVKHLEKNHLVVTADVPLASEVVKKGALAIDPRGRVYDENSVTEQLSIRNFMQTIREGRLIGGGPKPFDASDKQKFAISFEKQLSVLKKRAAAI